MFFSMNLGSDYFDMMFFFSRKKNKYKREAENGNGSYSGWKGSCEESGNGRGKVDLLITLGFIRFCQMGEIFIS